MVQQLEKRVSKLENEMLPRLVHLEAVFAQQQMSAAATISSWNQHAYNFPQSAVHTGGYAQHNVCFTPQHSAYGPVHQHSIPQHGVRSDDQLNLPSATGVSQSQSAPQCRQIQHRETTSYFPSARIDKAKLSTPEAVLTKYPTLRVESKIGILAVKLAKEAIFGKDVLAQCTVNGCRDLPALPLPELNELKQVLFRQFPSYWHTPEEFERIWERAGESIGQCAKGLRRKQT